MSKTEEIDNDVLPAGYEIQHYRNPDEYIVYKPVGTCKCCGRNDDRHMLMAISRNHPDYAHARAWVREKTGG